MNLDPFWIKLIVQIASALTAIAVIRKTAWKPFKTKFLSKFGEFYDKVNFITGELKPDGGSGSLRHQVDYMIQLMERLDRRQCNFFQFDPHGIFEMDATGACVWVNRAYLEISKRHPDEVLGMGWRNTVAEQDRDRVFKELKSAIADGRDLFIRMNMTDKRGTDIPVETRALAMHSAKDELIGYLGFVVRLDEAHTYCRLCQDMGIRTEDLLQFMEGRRSKEHQRKD